MKKSYIIILLVVGIMACVAGGSAGHKKTFTTDGWGSWYEDIRLPGEPMVDWHKEGTVEYDQNGNMQLVYDEWESYYTMYNFYDTSAEVVRR